MKLGQLIGNLKQSYTNCGGETILRPFSKKPKFSISMDQ